jgi:hypothetical protein
VPLTSPWRSVPGRTDPRCGSVARRT